MSEASIGCFFYGDFWIQLELCVFNAYNNIKGGINENKGGKNEKCISNSIKKRK